MAVAPSELDGREQEQLLADLARHPAWRVLQNLLEERRQAETFRLGRKLLTKGEVPVYEAAEARGFYKGAAWLLDQAENAFLNVHEREAQSSD